MAKKGTTRARIVSAYIDLFSSPVGQLVLGDLVKSTKFLTTTFDDNPHVTSFNEGQRAVVARILRTANMNHDNLKLIMEQLNKEPY